MQPAAKKLKADVVTDEQGRQRFHGAFTGGFSAGYFNTVGSAEGFKPAAFVSSRGNRAAVQQQSTRDFVDEEDGLVGGHLATKSEFDTFGEGSTASSAAAAAAAMGRASGSAIPGPVPSDLIVPSAASMGKRLLRTMGWKEGQGVGARVIRKATTAAASSTTCASTAAATRQGCRVAEAAVGQRCAFRRHLR